jgi:hypothetical protein
MLRRRQLTAWILGRSMKYLKYILCSATLTPLKALLECRAYKTNSVYSGRERTIPTERSPLVNEFSANFCECHVVSATDPYGSILGFLDRSRYFLFQVAPQLYSRCWVDRVPEPLLLRKSGSTGNQTQGLWICSQKLWPLDYRRGIRHTECNIWNVFAAYVPWHCSVCCLDRAQTVLLTTLIRTLTSSCTFQCARNSGPAGDETYKTMTAFITQLYNTRPWILCRGTTDIGDNVSQCIFFFGNSATLLACVETICISSNTLRALLNSLIFLKFQISFLQ